MSALRWSAEKGLSALVFVALTMASFTIGSAVADDQAVAKCVNTSEVTVVFVRGGLERGRDVPQGQTCDGDNLYKFRWSDTREDGTCVQFQVRDVVNGILKTLTVQSCGPEGALRTWQDPDGDSAWNYRLARVFPGAGADWGPVFSSSGH